MFPPRSEYGSVRDFSLYSVRLISEDLFRDAVVTGDSDIPFRLPRRRLRSGQNGLGIQLTCRQGKIEKIYEKLVLSGVAENR